jgi:hypothetical protein
MFAIVLVFTLIQLMNASSDHRQPSYSDVSITLDNFAWRTGFNPNNGDIYLYSLHTRDLIRISMDSRIDTLATDLFKDDSWLLMAVHPKSEVIRFWDTGVGRVFDFDLSDSELRRVDTSHNHMNQFGHAPFMDSTGSIFAMGGYGYWRFNRLFSQFDPETGQWEQVVDENREIVPESHGGIIFIYGNKVFYGVSDVKTNDNNLNLYVFDRESRRWNYDRVGSFLIKNLLSVRESFFWSDLSYSVDYNNGLMAKLNYRGNTPIINFFDVPNEQLYTVSTEIFGIYNPRAIFFSEIENKWVLLGHDISPTSRNILKVYTLNFSDVIPHMTVTKAPICISMPILFSILTLLGLSLLTFLSYKIVVHLRDKDVFSNKSVLTEKVLIIKTGGIVVDVTKNDQSIYVNEYPLMNRLWGIIADVVDNEVKNNLPLSEFDDLLFVTYSDNSQRSRERTKLFSMINEKFEEPIIDTQNSEYDKRIKIVHIQDHYFEVERSD